MESTMSRGERALPDRLSLVRRVEVACGCIRAVDSVSGLAVIERECPKARRRG